MATVKVNTIFPITVYCFVLAVYLLCQGGKFIWDNSQGFYDISSGQWLLAAIFVGLAVGAVIIGMGFFYLKKSCWKILFFSLAISVSSIAALVIISLLFMVTELQAFAPYYEAIQHSSGGWLAFLGFFLSEIIILYYLSSHEVLDAFGDMGPMIDPF